MDILSFVLVIGLCIYTAGAVLIITALGSVKPGSNTSQPSVSVVISARNERRAIGACLASLLVQDYPADRCEVIVADDRSDDGTSEVIERFLEVWNRLRVVRIDTVPPGISPKKHALMLALNAACGDIILQTDADCVVPLSWIRGMLRAFDEGTVMAAGLAPYLPEPGSLNSFIRHEYLWNAALAAGSTALGFGTHASGRNLAFRRDAFDRLGGYGPSERLLSGDDTLLLHRMQRLPGARVVTMPDASTHVVTRAPENLRAFVRQRIRHLSTGRLFSPLHLAAGCAVYGFHMLLVLFLVFTVFSRNAGVVFIAVLAVKLVIDALAAWRVRTVLNLAVQWQRFLINELLLIGYMAIMPILGLLVPVRWKEK